jgi:hypothetical protein
MIIIIEKIIQLQIINIQYYVCVYQKYLIFKDNFNYKQNMSKSLLLSNRCVFFIKSFFSFSYRIGIWCSCF